MFLQSIHATNAPRAALLVTCIYSYMIYWWW